MAIETMIPPPDDKPPRAKTAPKTARSAGQEKRAGRPAGGANRTTVKGIEETLNDVMSVLSMAAIAQGNIEAGVILSSRGPKVSAAWAELARVNPNVRRVLERMMKGGAWGGVIFSSLTVAIPVAHSYGVLPAGVPNPFGLSPDEVTEVMKIRAMFDGFTTENEAG